MALIGNGEINKDWGATGCRLKSNWVLLNDCCLNLILDEWSGLKWSLMIWIVLLMGSLYELCLMGKGCICKLYYYSLKPIFHCDAKPFALGTFASPNAKDTCWYDENHRRREGHSIVGS